MIKTIATSISACVPSLADVDKSRLNGLNAGMRALALACLIASTAPAAAMVGGASVLGADGLGRHLVLIVGSRGTACTGTAIARDLVLTVAHCVAPGADYKLVEFD